MSPSTIKAPVGCYRPLVGVSAWVREIQREVRQLAPFDSSALIVGPSGTGKELIARAIHAESPRSAGPFIPVNCAAITGTLFESHMFGHLAGAFTGSSHAALGCFRAAAGGTLFLDEIGELEPDLQVKLLRALQEAAVIPVGSHEEVPVDVRVVAATNRDLKADVACGRFREDLYYRLAVVELKTIPLCDRPEDIDVLAQFLLSSQCVRYGLPFKPLSAAASAALRGYRWPGNVRQLQNVLERAVLLSRCDTIEPNDLVLDGPAASEAHELVEARAQRAVELYEAAADSGEVPHAHAGDGHWLSMEEWDRLHLEATLAHTGYNQSAAARLLGLDRSVLRRRMQKLGVATEPAGKAFRRKPR